jgi:hypothetical protein
MIDTYQYKQLVKAQVIYASSLQILKCYPSSLLAIIFKEILKRKKRRFHLWRGTTFIWEKIQVGEYFQSVHY